MTVDVRMNGHARARRKDPVKLSVSAPELLCAATALLEGAASAAIFLAAALVYHLLVLHVAVSDLRLDLFAALAGVIGLVYAGFSYGHFSRLLSARERLSTSLAGGLYAWCAAYGVALLLAFVVGAAGDLSRVSIISAFSLGAPAALWLRAILINWIDARVAGGKLHFEQIAVVGLREHVVRYLVRSNLWQHGRQLSAVLYLEDCMGDDGQIASEDVTAFASAAVGKGVESIVFVAERDDLDAARVQIDALRRFSVNVDLVAIGLAGYRILELVRVGDSARLRVARKPIPRPMLAVKRAMDVLGAALGLILLSPVLVAAAAAIKLESPGPVFFRQERRGFNGSTFMIWKFRSMRTMESGHAMSQALRGDTRITRVGRLLRRTSVDELPQLLNVLRGEMSLVGPRPHAVSHDDELIEKLGDYAFRNRIRPGLTGWAQVQGYRGETRTPEQIQARVRCDLYYIENWTVFLDIWILFLTVFSRRAHHSAF